MTSTQAASGPPKWLDASAFLARVCAGMHVGELLHTESFSLFDSMTAIEIGDTKMDPGMARDSGVGSAEELIAAGEAPTALPGPTLLALLDQLLCLEATWHDHALLPQTVFASLYMLDTERLQGNIVLHAYCAGLRSTCSAVNDMVLAGQVCDDEDILIHMFNVRLDPPGRSARQAALKDLTAAEEWLEQQLVSGSSSRGSGQKAGSGKKQQGKQMAQQQQQAEQQALSSEVAAALLARVRLRRMLLQVLHVLLQTSAAGVGEAARLCKLAAAELSGIEATAGLAGGVKAPGLVPEVNRKHMGLAPPRPATPVSLSQALEHYRVLLSGLGTACSALKGVDGSWPRLQEMLTTFASTDAHAIVRSAVHMQTTKPVHDLDGPAADAIGTTDIGGSMGNGHAAAAAANGSGGSKRSSNSDMPPWCPSKTMVCREFGLPPSDIPGADTAMFIEQCSIALQGCVHAACLNRCRQRRRHRRQLEDWKNMLDHATNADLSVAFRAWMEATGWKWPAAEESDAVGPLSTWVVRQACGSMLSYLQLGFPLDLYAPYEYRALYWYSDYLIGAQQQTLRLLSAARPPLQQTTAPTHAACGKRRGGSSGGQLQTAAEHSISMEVLALEVERQMCQGMFKMTTGLAAVGLVATPPAALSTERERFEQRFGCFAIMLQPAVLRYSRFVAMMSTDGIPPVAILLSAAEHFAKAQRGAGMLTTQGRGNTHLEALIRSSKQNGVAIRIMVEKLVRSFAGTSYAPKERQQQAERQATDAEKAAEADADAEAPPPLPFQVSWDYKAALASSPTMFYPVPALRSSGKPAK